MNITTNNNLSFTGRKIPRYIYHLTNMKAYKSMCLDGYVKRFDNDPYLDSGAIHSIDLMNYYKYWGHSTSWGYNDLTLQEHLIRTAVKWVKSFFPEKNDLVILKIPTDKLDLKNLFIRSQKLFFEVYENRNGRRQKLNDELKSHLSGCTPATDFRLYQNRKEAVEFIYKADIPIDDVEVIGTTVNIPKLRFISRDFSNEIPAKGILSRAFAGLNQSKAIDFMEE